MSANSQSKREEPEGRRYQSERHAPHDKQAPVNATAGYATTKSSVHNSAVIEPFRLQPRSTAADVMNKYSRTEKSERQRDYYDSGKVLKSRSMDQFRGKSSSDVCRIDSNIKSPKITEASTYGPHTRYQTHGKQTQGLPSSRADVTSTLNSRNLESLNRENAKALKPSAAQHGSHARLTTTTQRSLQDDVSSVAGSSDADFVVTATGDILKRKSHAAKTIDKARNAELQMRSFDTPYEEFEVCRREAGQFGTPGLDYPVPDHRILRCMRSPCASGYVFVNLM